MTLHAPSRRELLVSSGVLFAWPFLPRLARAEGRDPRMLTIILRGALDGLAAVAPVGDPDWVKLRGDKALLLDLYHHTDAELARAIEGRLDLISLARSGDPTTMAPSAGRAIPQGFAAQVKSYFANAAGTAGKFLASPDGPRIGALAFNGWDT